MNEEEKNDNQAKKGFTPFTAEEWQKVIKSNANNLIPNSDDEQHKDYEFADNSKPDYQPSPQYSDESNQSFNPSDGSGNGTWKKFIKKVKAFLHSDKSDLKQLFEFRVNKAARNRFIVFLIGALFTPITLIGALLGFVRSYNRFLRIDKILPEFYPMRSITRVAMIIGAILLPLVMITVSFIIYRDFNSQSSRGFLFMWIYLNSLLSLIVFAVFNRWKTGVNNSIVESEKFGSARFAYDAELSKYEDKTGIYIGGGYSYPKQGHILTVAGSRAGKFTNLLAPNLLGASDFSGSWVVIDPKGEIAAVTSRYQKESGQNVVVLNPWGLLNDRLPASHSYNPLDILDAANPNFVDDCSMLSEMLVPVETGRNKFFSDSARAIIAGLILYIAVSKEGEERTLKTLWKWVRYPNTEWMRILAEMENSEDELNGENLMYAAGEIEKLTQSGGNTWGSILATVLQATEFLKSQALQKSLETGFDPKTLADGKTSLYVIIPADKLQSHSRWLRLVVTSTMRAVIRKPQKQVCFILDEFAALGYLPEIETALGAYAGFNVQIWAVLQSLVQLQNLYDKNWEIFIGQSAVRHFFGINNNFDAKYISEAIGSSSYLLETRRWFGVKDAKATARPLITPDELRVETGKKIFTFIDDVSPTYFDKLPYQNVPHWDNRADRNPYI